MQLTEKRGGRVAAALCMVTANLFAATGTMAQSASNTDPNAYDLPASEPGSTSVDTAVLFYKEDGGRVQAIEPMVALTHNAENGAVYTARFTYDTLTGATPNGAAPWTGDQTFVSPAAQHGTETRTGASGGTIVKDVITGVQSLQYVTPAGQLPLDSGFKDRRYALDLAATLPVTSTTRFTAGINGSTELDYKSYSGRASIAQDLNNKTTTLSLGVNFEHDVAEPAYGVPTPRTAMSGRVKNGKGSKDVLSLIGGVTQVVTPGWVVQANYSYSKASGYQTDPYKIVSYVDATSGAPIDYFYESRPDKRTRHAFYLGNKIALGSLVTDVSGRYYTDDWGISSYTAEISEHVPVGKSAYVEPGVRYYHQTAADFFAYYLPSNQVIPGYFSADSRLDSFNALTYSLSGGIKLNRSMEVYGLAEYYRQSKAGTKGQLPGANSNLDLFAGTNAISLMTGVKFKF